MAYSGIPTYNTLTKPRGSGVIIVNTFEKYGDLKREGAEKEIANLVNLVTSLDLIQEIQKDLTKEQIILFLQAISKRQRRETSMIFIAICSHGGEDGVYGVDCGEQKYSGASRGDSKEYALTAEEIKKIFNSINCPMLKDKPKLIVLNGCIEKEVKSRSSSFARMISFEHLYDYSDFLTIYPTLSGQYRDSKHDSIFIEVLCDTLLAYHGRDVAELIAVINGTLTKKAQIVKINGNSVKLTEKCITESSLTKKLCLTKVN